MKFLDLITTGGRTLAFDTYKTELVNFYAPENLSINVFNLKYNNCDFSFVQNINNVTRTTTGINWMQFKNLSTANRVNFSGQDFYFPVLMTMNNCSFEPSNTINSFYAPIFDGNFSFGSAYSTNISIKDVYAPLAVMDLRQNVKSLSNINVGSISGRNINLNFSNINTLGSVVSQNSNYRGKTIDNCKIKFSNVYFDSFSSNIISITNSEISGVGANMFRYCLPNINGTTVHVENNINAMFYSKQFQNDDYFKDFTFENIAEYSNMFYNCRNLQEISYEFLYNLFSNSTTNSFMNFMFSYCNNLSNNSVKNIVRALIDSNISPRYKNLSYANSSSPFRYTPFNNSYYSEYHQALTNLGWTY